MQACWVQTQYFFLYQVIIYKITLLESIFVLLNFNNIFI